jgi:hypothetical protein
LVVSVALVSDEPSNAASEHFRRNVAFFTDSASPPGAALRAGLRDDFVYEDRRRGPNFPPADAESVPKYLDAIFQAGVGQPRFASETLAVRGERFAASMFRLDYGNGMLHESILVTSLDATLSLLQCAVEFDLDDVDGAIAELDRMHRQADTN